MRSNRIDILHIGDAAVQQAHRLGVSREHVKLLVRFGTCLYRDGHGASVIGLNKGARLAMRQQIGEESYIRVKDALNICAIVRGQHVTAIEARDGRAVQSDQRPGNWGAPSGRRKPFASPRNGFL